MNACVLTIGDELLQGFTTDTNSSWLGSALLPYDITIQKKITVGDDINSIIQESQNILSDNYDFLFVTGGLGPTHDDITKEAFRQLLDDELIFDESYYLQEQLTSLKVQKVLFMNYKLSRAKHLRNNSRKLPSSFDIYVKQMEWVNLLFNDILFNSSSKVYINHWKT